MAPRIASVFLTGFTGFGGGFASIHATGIVAFQGNNPLMNPSQGIDCFAFRTIVNTLPWSGKLP